MSSLVKSESNDNIGAYPEEEEEVHDQALSSSGSAAMPMKFNVLSLNTNAISTPETMCDESTF
jgi:hypothetical protein